jgi:uroporphyrinogen decarboxylase
MNHDAQKLAGVHVAAITSDDVELRGLIEAQGGRLSSYDCAQPIESDNFPAAELSLVANQLLTGELDVVVFLTAAGVNYFIEQASRQVDSKRLLDSIADINSIAGSEAASTAFAKHGIETTIAVGRNKSWRDVLVAIDSQIRIENCKVGVEEANSIHSISAGLEARGARVVRIPIYPQAPPENRQPSISFFERLEARDLDSILFLNAENVARFCFLSKQFGRARLTSHSLDNHIVLCIGEEAAELLNDRQIPVDFVTTNHELPAAIEEIADQMSDLSKQKQTIKSSLSGPASASSDSSAPWYDSPFMKACRGEPTDVTPIWMMRQAGRYMAEYREVRAKVSFLELCANPQLCSEVMCTAVNRLGVDAAIIFSDLLPILVPMGMDLEFTKGGGPQIHNPIRTSADIDRVKPLENNDELHFVMETVTQTRNDLPADMPLIGFAGAPFTLASYMIEGGASRNYAFTKQLMYSDPGAWDQLMQHLTSSILIYLKGQVEAGAQCLQLFDSWAGCLGFEDYKNFVLPYVKQIIAGLPSHVPLINFATGNPALLPLLADTRAAVIGIDWRTRLDDAWQTVGYDRAVQGNLDPIALLTDPAEIRKQAKFVLDQAAGRAGHIFNLGHGILPQTPVDNAIALVDAVHELSQK